MKKIILITLITFFIGHAQADTLMIDRIAQEQSMSMPARGLTMNQVIKQYGEPKVKKDAVGQPPITEWQYDNFSVYFEKKWVITSVAYKTKK